MSEERWDRIESKIDTLTTDVGVSKPMSACSRPTSACSKPMSACSKADVGVLKADVGVLKADVGVLKTDVGRLDVGFAELRDNEVSLHVQARAARSESARAARGEPGPIQAAGGGQVSIRQEIARGFSSCAKKWAAGCDPLELAVRYHSKLLGFRRRVASARRGPDTLGWPAQQQRHRRLDADANPDSRRPGEPRRTNPAILDRQRPIVRSSRFCARSMPSAAVRFPGPRHKSAVVERRRRREPDARAPAAHQRPRRTARARE